MMGGSVFIPRFRNLKKGEKRDFIKGYCMLINSGGGANAEFFRRLRRGTPEEARQLRRLVRLRQHLWRARGALRESRAHQ